jgi:hypothetical protein
MDLDLLDQIKEAMDRSAFLSSYLLGVYVEGPFIVPEKKGGILLQALEPLIGSTWRRFFPSSVERSLLSPP